MSLSHMSLSCSLLSSVPTASDLIFALIFARHSLHWLRFPLCCVWQKLNSNWLKQRGKLTGLNSPEVQGAVGPESSPSRLCFPLVGFISPGGGQCRPSQKSSTKGQPTTLSQQQQHLPQGWLPWPPLRSLILGEPITVTLW